MDRYDIIERIGKGTYGTVFRAKDKQLNENVAIKTIELESEEGIPSTAIREIALLKWLKHPNVVSLHDVIHIHDKLYMVFELLELDLKHYLDVCPNGLQISIIKSLLYQLLQGLSFCHKQRILHRDLKPANILLNRAGQLKIADFGLARSFALPVSTLKHEVITLWYRSPELLLGSTTYGTEVDIWSIGCIFAEMLTSAPLFNGGTDEAQIELIFGLCGAPIIDDEALRQAKIRNSINEAHQPTANPDVDQNTPGAHLDMSVMARPGQPPADFDKDNLGGYIASLPLFNKFRSLICDNPKVKTPYDSLNIASSLPQALKDPNCLDLLSKLLALDPEKRVTAEQAMAHPFFDDAKAKTRRSSHAANSQAQQQQQQVHHQVQQQQQPQHHMAPQDMQHVQMQQQQQQPMAAQGYAGVPPNPNQYYQPPPQQPMYQQPGYHPQQQQQPPQQMYQQQGYHPQQQPPQQQYYQQPHPQQQQQQQPRHGDYGYQQQQQYGR